MRTFYEWLAAIAEERGQAISPEILKSYDVAIRQQLQAMATTIVDPQVRAQFQELIDCPIIDARGNCRDFGEYVMATLLRSGVQDRFDVEQALQYVFEKMLLPRSDSGGPRNTIFTGFDPNASDSGEHFRARFLSWLSYAVNNIRRGKIRRLAKVEPRPAKSVSIGIGRTREGNPGGTISPDQIPSRSSAEAPFAELVQDVASLLRAREPAYGLPLSGIFAAIIAGKNSEQQRAEFGDRTAREARPIIVRIIRDYAQSTDNYQLLALVDRFQDFRANQPSPPSRQTPKTARPVLSPQERDYQSILQVIDRYQGQPVGTAQLGSYRSRWLSYPPRTADSVHRNRLDDTLARMVRDGVLRTVAGNQGGLRYAAGPAYDQYRRTAGT
jgi:hypothetical protein